MAIRDRSGKPGRESHPTARAYFFWTPTALSTQPWIRKASPSRGTTETASSKSQPPTISSAWSTISACLTRFRESEGDQDLGSGGALILPPMKDAKGKIRYLAIGAGKDQNIYIVDRTNMGKFNPN